MTTAQDGGQPDATAAFTPSKYTWYSFLLETESTPGTFPISRHINCKKVLLEINCEVFRKLNFCPDLFCGLYCNRHVVVDIAMTLQTGQPRILLSTPGSESISFLLRNINRDPFPHLYRAASWYYQSLLFTNWCTIELL